ncbi:MAG: N-acetylmuramoyl-L-alanine amidase [Chloroflexi bacterium]|nr:N-acetylmuramoyl-L-alanine amidase [Chloroflexota bacterium]
MRMRHWLSLGLLAFLLVIGLPAAAQTPITPSIESVTFTVGDWETGAQSGLVTGENGLQAENGRHTAVYTSPSITAPFQFNALVPRWIADIPDGAAMEIFVRTAKTPGIWGEWYDIHPNEDWTEPGSTASVGEMILAPDTDQTHRYAQYRIIFMPGTAVRSPNLQEFTLTFIDSTAGPTMEEMLAQQAKLDAAQRPSNAPDSYPRPSVISRTVWCIYADCTYTAGLEYSPATHLIVHHTVSSNDNTNWVATVRAIWNYHTYTQNWGDIGYNYLIDPNGIIYEGHLNADYLNLDVIGTHASAANAGGLGTALLGTFTTPEEYPVSGTPSQAMLTSLANLFAWKADQRNIEILDASRMVNTSWGLPHIMGHRDVYGGTNTLCPGGNAHALLPWLRTAVAQRLGQVSPYTFVSETSSAFSKSNAIWHEAPGGCGWQGHAYYTWSVTNPASSTNWGEWRLTLPQTGYYEIEVYAPYCDTNNSETTGATYEIRHNGVTDTAVVSHQANVGLWMSLGTYYLTAGQTASVYLSDLTTTDSGVGVWFDDIRFRPVTDVSISDLAPADGWVKQNPVDFTWQISNPTGVQTTTLEVAADAAFSNVLLTQTWGTAVTNFSHTFTQDYTTLYWRVKTINTGGQSMSPTASFGLDTTPPTSAVTALTHHVAAGYFDVAWEGADAVSGVAGYTVQYRAEGAVDWSTLVTHTLATTAVFTPTNPSTLYWFRSQAVDIAGNTQTPGGGDIRSDQAAIIFNPQAQPLSPANGDWLNQYAVSLSWQLAEIDTVLSSTVQIATDAAFNQTIASETVTGPATSHTITLTQDYADLYWRVTVDFTPPLPGLTSTVTSEAGHFRLDRTLPESLVTAVYTVTHNTYLIVWQGQDNLSGIANYTIEYQAVGDSDWTPWITQTSATSGLFTPPTAGQPYAFRSQATDLAGNIETPHTTADLDTDQANAFPHAIMLPMTQR